MKARNSNSPPISFDVFYSKIDSREVGQCWNWSSTVIAGGYGVIRRRGKLWGAHRIAWMLFHGTIPKGLCVCHRCDNRRCVNPEHLFLGTRRDNNLDMVSKGRHSPPPHRMGERHPGSKLTWKAVHEIRARYSPRHGMQTALAREYGVTVVQIKNIVTGKHWKERKEK